MKKFLLTIASAAVLSATAFGQTQSIRLTTTGTSNTAGSFNPGSAFSLDTTITFTGYTADGLSYWLQVPTALAPYITITSEQYFTFTDGNQIGSKTFVDSSGADNGFISDKGASNSGDLGGTAVDSTFDVPPGAYRVTTLNFTLSASAPAGTYSLNTTTARPKTSEVSDNTFTSHNAPGSTYMITVVPEPSTFVFVLGGVGILAASFSRRLRRA